MITRQHLSALSAPLMWMLLGIPLSVWAGVGWDAFQAPNGTQMFLGAANNFYLLWLSPLVLLAVPRTLLRTLLTRAPMAGFAAGGIFVLGWMIAGVALNDRFSTLADAVVPLVAIANTGLALLAWMVAREARAAGQGPALAEAFKGCLLLAGMGMVAGMVVHLLGAKPERQIFLYVDGFGNIRTLGEALMLALAAAIAWAWKKPGLWAFLAATALACALAWTGTRAAWVGLGGALLLGALLWLPGWKAAAHTLGAVILGAALSLALPLPDSTYGIGRLAELVRETGVAIDTGVGSEAPSGTVAPSEPDSARLLLWGWGVDRIAEAPLLGHGHGAMGTLDRPHHARFKHLHNLPLDLAFGLGVPMGIGLTLLLVWATLSAFVQARRDRLFLLPLCAGAVLATSLFAGLFLFPISVVAAAIGLSGAAGRRLPVPSLHAT